MSRIGVIIDGQTFEVEVGLHHALDTELMVSVDGETVRVSVPNPTEEGALEWVLVDNRPYEILVDPDLRWIKSASGLHHLEVRDLEAPVTRPLSADGRVKAPIPGLITRLLVELDQVVQVGQPLLVLEAMKMENQIHAPRSGRITQLNVEAGQTVILNEVLVEIS